MGEEQKVYLVESDRGLRTSLAWMIRSAGFRVSLFSTGRAFLESLGADARGCAVIGANLSDMSGTAVIEALAARGSTLPLMIASGYGKIGRIVQPSGDDLGESDLVTTVLREIEKVRS